MGSLENLKKFRSEKIDTKYIGFSVNSGSIKPVHLANGLLRTIKGLIYDNEYIAKFSYVSGQNGPIKHTAIKAVYKEFVDKEMLDDSISEQKFDALRVMAQSLIGADKGVYDYKHNGMVSYTIPNKYFLTDSKTHTMAGDLIGSLIKATNSDIIDLINNDLDDIKDPISVLFIPTYSYDGESKYDSDMNVDEIIGFKNHTMDEFINKLKLANDCLCKNLEKHPNKLVHLRQFNLLSIFEIILYISNLEHEYGLSSKNNPILLDFSNDSKGEIAMASTWCVMQINQSLARCYSKLIADELKNEYLWIEDLINYNGIPSYDGKTPKSKKDKETALAFREIFENAKDRAKLATNDDDKYLIFGEAIYDMLEYEGSSNVIKYIKNLALKAGIFYPQSNRVINKRFNLSLETLEVLIKNCVEPNQSITVNELQDLLWDRFNIVIGGRQKDVDILQECGITHADFDALDDNKRMFENVLENMNLAEILADGILKIKTGDEY